jgi:putative SOS response-associated peptidase YedK
MCGRFCIAVSPGEIKERYNIITHPEYKSCYNISPGQRVLTLTWVLNKSDFVMAKWGFQPDMTDRIINARIETVKEKSSFRDLFINNRCIIPASGYYEWKKEGTRKIPYYFSLESGEILSFAGLFRPGGDGGEVIILTTMALYPYSDIHERMPVILNRSNEQLYLSKGNISVAHEVLRMFEVSSRVNQVNMDDPDLIKPLKHSSVQKNLFDLC